MKRPLVCSVLLAWVCLGSTAARAEQPAPRDLWPQATAAIADGDVGVATKKSNELLDLGRAYGIRAFPLYAESAAIIAQQATKEGKKPIVAWGTKVANDLDPDSPGVAFIRADGHVAEQNWMGAVTQLVRGFRNLFLNHRSSLLGQSDMLVTIALALSLTAVVFAIALFVRYAKAMAHDFREILGRRMRGGSVSVLAFALLFLPIFLWLGPVWLIFYWFIIFFGYANGGERVMIIVLALMLALAPVAIDLASTWMAGVDSPVVMAAIAGEERAYRPDALRRLQELVAIAPDDSTLHLLLGNLYLQDGSEPQASQHYRRSLELHDSAGAHVNLGNLHFLNNDFSAAVSEYEKAEALDRNLAIAFYNHSIASGEMYKFDDQARQLDQAKRIDRAYIERISSNPPAQKVVMYRPPIPQAWTVAEGLAKRGVARTLFGNWVWFDPLTSARNPLTVGGLLTIVLAPMLLMRRRRAGFAGACIKCGRTYCHRCKSARESATYCTQCIHIYLKRDGVSLATKRSKLEEVSDHHTAEQRRNKLFATLLPGSAQIIEGRTSSGIIGMFAFLFFVSLAVLVGRLAPVLAPPDLPKLAVRALAILLAVIMWFLLTLPVYRRRATV